MKLLGSLKSLITEAASIDDIKKSISQKQVCSIYYNGDEPGGKGLREIEPVALGRSKAGNMVLRGWDRTGASHTAYKGEQPLPSWRLFRVDLMNKLVVAKKIMDVHNQTPRAGNNGMLSSPMLEQYNAPPATYNIPQEFMGEQTQPMMSSPTTPPQLPTKDRILNSKLPDEIKKLMMEHPIDKPNNMGGPTLSNEVVEAAARLMKTDARGNVQESNIPRQPQSQHQPQNFSGIDYSLLKSIIRDTITEVLTEKGLVAESSSKTKEQISFRVGQHVFEGVVTKIKKMK